MDTDDYEEKLTLALWKRLDVISVSTTVTGPDRPVVKLDVVVSLHNRWSYSFPVSWNEITGDDVSRRVELIAALGRAPLRN